MTYTANIDNFFDCYASMMNCALLGGTYNGDIIMNSFADFFVGANPLGVAGGKNDAVFSKSIQQGIEFYKQIGIISMNIVSKEITVLDPFHAMIKVFWKSFYRNSKISGEIPFEVVYMVQCRNESIKIFAYITGDEQAALRAHMLIS